MPLPTNIDDLRRRALAGEQFEFLFFWGHQLPKDDSIGQSCLSQWYPAAFEVDGITYPTAEHWMMAEKARLFGDDGTLQQILAAPDPKTAKAMGRKVANFDGEVWGEHSRRIVTQGNVAKFEQNEAMRDYLLGTSGKVLVEASPYDRIWGIGLRESDKRASDPEERQGANLLGFVLMDVRCETNSVD